MNDHRSTYARAAPRVPARSPVHSSASALFATPLLVLSLGACATLPGRAPADTDIAKVEASSPGETAPNRTVWSGERVLDQVFTVAAGASLEVRPGSVLRLGPAGTVIVTGRAVFEGTPENPVRIEGSLDAPAAAVQVRHPAAALTLRHVVITGATTGLAATEGAVTVEDVLFIDNHTGATVEASAKATVASTTFTGNGLGLLVGNGGQVEVNALTFSDNEIGLQASRSAKIRLDAAVFTNNGVGYGQHNACDAILEAARFSGNDRAISLIQTRRSPIVRRGTFTNNPVAMAATLFSNPLVEATVFESNGQAFTADQFSVPFLRFNRFENNEGAVRLDKRSGARIEGNLFTKNEVALFADFSSYPRVTGNRFEDNGWHVKLGIYESADFERRFGSGGIMRGEVRDRNTRNPLLMKDQMPRQDKTFTLAGNAWDEATLREMSVGPDENLSRFWDGRDQPSVTYEGYGSESYAVDVIIYSPPLGEAPPVGPEAWAPMSTTAHPTPSRKLGLNPPKGHTGSPSPRSSK